MAEILRSDARDVMLTIYESYGQRIDNEEDRQAAFNTLVATLKEGYGWTKADFTNSIKLDLVELVTAETKKAEAWRRLTLKSLDIAILSFFPIKLVVPTQADIGIQPAIKAVPKPKSESSTGAELDEEPARVPKKGSRRDAPELDRSIFESAPAPKWELSDEMDALLGYRK